VITLLSISASGWLRRATEVRPRPGDAGHEVAHPAKEARPV